MRMRTSFIAIGAVLALTAAACSSDDGEPTAAPGTTAETAAATDGGEEATYATSYEPQPGDLLFYTNASISYNSTAKHPWVVVIDAKTKKIVAASEIGDVDSSPHGLGVSPDGSALYLPAGIGSPIPANGLPPGTKVEFGNGVTVIDAKTLKSTQSIATLDAPHHIQLLDDSTVMSDAWGTKQVLFTLDPASDNTMTHELAAEPFGGRPYIAFPSPDGKSIYMTVRPEKPTDPAAAELAPKEAWLSRVNLADWSVDRVADVGPGAVWTAFSRDGKFAYVTIGEEDWVEKVDLATGEVVGKVATGRGPYGAVLSPDEKRLFVVSKGEGGRGQRGGTFVVLDAENMKVIEERPSCKAFVCQADHALISPDGTELWVDNNMGYVTIFDLETLELTDEVTMPLLADPHGGIFVQYDEDGNGHVVMDIGGPHGGVSPYLADTSAGIPTLAQALEEGWGGAAASSPLALGLAPAAAPAEDEADAVTVNVGMDDFFFEPKELTVPAGANVTFQISNAGQSVHNFISEDIGISSADVATNGDLEVDWTASAKPGTYTFMCTYHPGMEGTITIT